MMKLAIAVGIIALIFAFYLFGSRANAVEVNQCMRVVEGVVIVVPCEKGDLPPTPPYEPPHTP